MRSPWLLLAMERQTVEFFQTDLGMKIIPVLEWIDRMTKDSVDTPAKQLNRRVIVFVTLKVINSLLNSLANTDTLLKSSNDLKSGRIEDTMLDEKSFHIYMGQILGYTSSLLYKEIGSNIHKKYINYSFARFHELAIVFKNFKILQNIQWDLLISWIESELEEIEGKEFWNRKIVRKKIEELLNRLLLTLEIPDEFVKHKYLSYTNNSDINEKYIYMLELIYVCKAAAPNLTPTVWEGIENLMLKPPSH